MQTTNKQWDNQKSGRQPTNSETTNKQQRQLTNSADNQQTAETTNKQWRQPTNSRDNQQCRHHKRQRKSTNSWDNQTAETTKKQWQQPTNRKPTKNLWRQPTNMANNQQTRDNIQTVVITRQALTEFAVILPANSLGHAAVTAISNDHLSHLPVTSSQITHLYLPDRRFIFWLNTAHIVSWSGIVQMLMAIRCTMYIKHINL